MKETDILEPNTPYGASKAAATLYCQYRAREARLPIVIFRLFSVYGPWEEKGRLIPELMLGCIKGEDIQLASPHAVRDFIYVGDVVNAYLKVVRIQSEPGTIFNIAGGIQHSVGDAATIVKGITRSKSVLRWGTAEGRAFDTRIWLGDAKKARKMLGLNTHTLEDGLRKSAQWFKKHRNAYR